MNTQSTSPAGGGLSERREENIVFLPASKQPQKNEPWEDCACLLLNPCDGFHLVHARFDGDGEFMGFYDWAGTDAYEQSFYVAWAMLPDSIPLTNYFDPSRGLRLEGRK